MVERKGPKINLYEDQRDVSDKKEGEDEGMDDWTQEDLEKAGKYRRERLGSGFRHPPQCASAASCRPAVKEKHGTEQGQPNKTNIICKYFLDAVEKRQYGWFWVCPNGGKEARRMGGALVRVVGVGGMRQGLDLGRSPAGYWVLVLAPTQEPRLPARSASTATLCPRGMS